jgi:UDP-N-acetylmuramyl pentapeptide phosphotransferase/UDP-N-acetylglucosamine-1-phosphate transferase
LVVFDLATVEAILRPTLNAALARDLKLMILHLLVVACIAAMFARQLLRLAPRIGWLDPRPGSSLARKSQIPAAPVGGAVLALVLVALAWTQFGEDRGWPLWAQFPAGIGLSEAPGDPAWFSAALIAALLVGSADDWRLGGLSPAVKVCAQLAASIPLALVSYGQGYLGLSAGPAAALLALLCAVAAMNLVNTWDNFDGAALSLGALAGLRGPLVLTAGCLALLPLNLRRAPAGAAQPQLYLGDAGSHLLGMLVALMPQLWPLLWLPALDLLRLSIERLQRGSRPWIADRHHLAHLLASRGLSRAWVLVALNLASAPAALLPAVAGLPLSAACYLLLWLRAR